MSGPAANDNAEQRRIDLKVGEQFNPLAIGGSGEFDFPLVFVGYGITAKDEKYGDYAVLERKRQSGDSYCGHELKRITRTACLTAPIIRRCAVYTKSVQRFRTRRRGDHLRYGRFRHSQKRRRPSARWQAEVDRLAEENAKFKEVEYPSTDNINEHREQVAKAVETIRKLADEIQSAGDPLPGFEVAAGDDGRNFPVLYVRRSVMDGIIQEALKKPLAAIEKEIDEAPSPRSQSLAGWRAIGETKIERQMADAKNVIAVMEGDGPHANETVIVGAHYDHLGWGGPGSFTPEVKEIHNGADDNASGAIALVEVAREIVQRGKPPGRRIVFMAFSGEERGLLGSAHYMRNPLYPLAGTVAMLNMDMVGRLDEEKLIVHGTGTANVWDEND